MNRLPSAALGGAIPVTRLSPDAELFSLPPRVFGCRAFVHDHAPGLSKLAPRARKGVFVGYARTQKGYRVYFPDTHHYITSADVSFHEDVPFFPSSSRLRIPVHLPRRPLLTQHCLLSSLHRPQPHRPLLIPRSLLPPCPPHLLTHLHHLLQMLLPCHLSLTQPIRLHLHFSPISIFLLPFVRALVSARNIP